MANPYFNLFNAPGSKAFSSAGLIARLPVSMTGIGIITMLSQVRGSYWLAGAVAATFAFPWRCLRRKSRARRIVTAKAACCRMPPVTAT